MTHTLVALDDHPMNWAIGLLILGVTGAVVLGFLFYALAHVSAKKHLTEPAVAVAFVWIMLAIFFIGSTG